MLQVTLLGESAIRENGEVRTRSPRAVALLAFLVAHAGTGQSRQRLSGLFWPDSTDEQALTNLRRELHHVRGALGNDPSLVVTARDLGWHDEASCQVDVRQFQHAAAAARAAAAEQDVDGAVMHGERALTYYKGDFMPALDDDWAVAVRTALQDLCVEVLDLVRDARAGAHDTQPALAAARQRIALRPLEEVGYRRLMELLADMGDRAGAVSTYHRCASVLEEELGVDPDPQTRALLTTLLADTEPEPEASNPLRRGRSGPAAAPLVGRGRDLSALAEAWQRTMTGAPNVGLVRGDPGVGKTRLVTELADAVKRRGGAVAIAQCFGSSGRLPLGPVADWLSTADLRASVARLDPVWQMEVDRLVPTSTTAPANVAGSRAVVDAWHRHRFFDGLSRALFGVDRPLLLVLDNVQWCDAETLAFLLFSLGIVDDAKVMLLVTMRSEAEAEMSEWIQRVRSSRPLTEIALGPLDVEDTAAVAAGIVGQELAEDDAALLHAATGGFPLFVVEAARSLDEAGTSMPIGNLSEVLRTRLEHLTPPAQEIASLAAAVGRDFDLGLLCEASDLDTDTVVRAVDELWSRRIAREVGEGYDFTHDLLRDAAYSRISPARRWLLHRRIAQGLELLHADHLDAVSGQLAKQYASAGRSDRAIAYYRRAAQVAAGVFAHTEAIRLHEEALELIRALPAGRERLSLEMGTLEAIAAPMNAQYGYASERLRRVHERGMELAEQLGHREFLCNASVGLWTSYFVRGQTSEAYDTALRALELLPPDSPLRGPAHFALGGSAQVLGRPSEAIEHLSIAIESGESYSLSVGTRTDIHASAYAAHAYWMLGLDDQAIASSSDAIRRARAADTPYNLAVALAYSAVTQQLLNDRDTARVAVEELARLCERYNFTYYREWGLVVGGWVQGGEAGLQSARHGISSLAAQNAFARMPYWLSLQALILSELNQHDAARATLDAAMAASAARGEPWWLPEILRLRAAYDHGDARAVRLRTALDLARSHGSVVLADRCAVDLSDLDGDISVPAARSAVRAATPAGRPHPNADGTLHS
jgi:DNA-binding SARP family transcriptional activator/tetratricopeptide (TPR) repeat protein